MAGFGYKKNILEDNDNPFRMGTLRIVNTVRNADEVSVAKWAAEIPERGEYAVYVSYSSLPNSATDATYRINSLAGTSEFKVNQRMGGGTWIYLGHFPLDKVDEMLSIKHLSLLLETSEKQIIQRGFSCTDK